MHLDPYAILELRSDASDADVKSAYRRLAALYHPDRNPGFQAAATERLKELNEAYSLITALRRQPLRNDQPRSTRQGGQRGSGASNTDERAGADSRRASEGRERGRADSKGASETRERARADSEREKAESRGATRRGSIAANLARIGFLSTAAATDHVVVEVLATMVPGAADVLVCAGYSEVRSTAAYPHREQSGRFLRPLSIKLGASLGGGGLGSAVKPPPTQVVVCTSEILLWTSSEFRDADGVVVEERVTAHTTPLAEILGASLRKKGRVDILIEEGPTLTFRMEPATAAELSVKVDAAAAVA